MFRVLRPKLLRPPVVQNQLKALHLVHRLCDHDAALRSLDGAADRRLAVLGADGRHLEAAVIHGENSAGVNLPLHVGLIADALRLSKESHRRMDVVHVEIHQRAARPLWVKGRQHLPPFKGIIPGRILAVVEAYDLDGSQILQVLLQGLKHRQIVDVHGLEEHFLLLRRQLFQLPHLRRVGRARFLQDHMFSGQKGLLRKPVVEVVGQRHVDGVHITLQQLLIVQIISVQPVFPAHGLCFLLRLFRPQQHCPGKMEFVHRLHQSLYDHPCPQNSDLHPATS